MGGKKHTPGSILKKSLRAAGVLLRVLAGLGAIGLMVVGVRRKK